ncbi:hypothetical protein D3C75_857670 [compost metagenome]
MTVESGVIALAQAVGADIKTINTKVAKTRAAGYDDLVVNAAATGSITLDLNTATVFDLTLTGDTSINFSNLPAPTNQVFSWVVKVTMGGTLRTLTWPTTTWYTPGGTEPTAPAVGKLIEYIFSTQNGVNIIGRKGSAT